MKVQKYDHENRSIIISISVDELDIVAEALRLPIPEADEYVAPASEWESTPEGIIGLAYYTKTALDVLKRLPGEIDAAIDHYKKLED